MFKIDVYVKILMIILGIPLVLIPINSCHPDDVTLILVIRAGILVLILWAIRKIIKY
jgi:hypothetical protein